MASEVGKVAKPAPMYNLAQFVGPPVPVKVRKTVKTVKAETDKDKPPAASAKAKATKPPSSNGKAKAAKSATAKTTANSKPLLSAVRAKPAAVSKLKKRGSEKEVKKASSKRAREPDSSASDKDDTDTKADDVDVDAVDEKRSRSKRAKSSQEDDDARFAQLLTESMRTGTLWWCRQCRELRGCPELMRLQGLICKCQGCLSTLCSTCNRQRTGLCPRHYQPTNGLGLVSRVPSLSDVSDDGREHKAKAREESLPLLFITRWVQCPTRRPLSASTRRPLDVHFMNEDVARLFLGEKYGG